MVDFQWVLIFCMNMANFISAYSESNKDNMRQRQYNKKMKGEKGNQKWEPNEITTFRDNHSYNGKHFTTMWMRVGLYVLLD